MKPTIFPALIFSAMLFSCNSSNTEKKIDDAVNEMGADAGIEVNSEGKTGTFSFDGKEVSGRVETQHFGSDKTKANFSVLCQHNESDDSANANFELLQVTFRNENDATTNPSLKIYDGGSQLPMTEPEPGIVAVSLSGVGSGLDKDEFTGNEKSTGTIRVSGKTVTIKDLVLFSSSGERKTINAMLPY